MVCMKVILDFPPCSCYNDLVVKSAYSSADRASASGAGSAGSSPARRAISITNSESLTGETSGEGFGFLIDICFTF